MTCSEKRGYRSKKLAKRAALRSQAKGGVTLRIFLCRYCDEWHLTHLSQATCARIAELMPKLFLPSECFDKEGRIGLDAVLSRDFLIAAFGDGNTGNFYMTGYYVTEMEKKWKANGIKLLEAYWTSGLTGVEELLLELLTDSSPKEPDPK